MKYGNKLVWLILLTTLVAGMNCRKQLRINTYYDEEVSPEKFAILQSCRPVEITKLSDLDTASFYAEANCNTFYIKPNQYIMHYRYNDGTRQSQPVVRPITFEAGFTYELLYRDLDIEGWETVLKEWPTASTKLWVDKYGDQVRVKLER